MDSAFSESSRFCRGPPAGFFSGEGFQLGESLGSLLIRGGGQSESSRIANALACMLGKDGMGSHSDWSRSPLQDDMCMGKYRLHVEGSAAVFSTEN